MSDTPNQNPSTAERRAAKIDALAKAIINEAKEHELEKRRQGDEFIAKLERWLVSKSKEGGHEPH